MEEIITADIYIETLKLSLEHNVQVQALNKKDFYNIMFVEVMTKKQNSNVQNVIWCIPKDFLWTTIRNTTEVSRLDLKIWKNIHASYVLIKFFSGPR